jgi:hypothetical protein
MSAGPRVLLLTLSERISGRGNRYMSGWLGKASVVAFQAEEPDKWGNAVWDVYVSTPEPRPEQQQSKPEAGQVRSEQRPQSPHSGDAAKPSARPESVTQRAPARHQGQGEGWRGPSAYRRGNGAQRAPAAGHEPFYDDDLADIGR